MAKLVIVDTNVFISSLLSPHSKVSEVVEYVIAHERIVLCREILDELNEVAKRTKTSRELEVFLSTLDYIMVKSSEPFGEHPQIRDPCDLPILMCAVQNDVDILLTGDKDFLSLRPLKGFSLRILSPAEYYEWQIHGHK